MHAHVNLIPLNYVKESPFVPSTREDVDAMFASYDRKVVVHASTALSDAEEVA